MENNDSDATLEDKINTTNARKKTFFYYIPLIYMQRDIFVSSIFFKPILVSLFFAKSIYIIYLPIYNYLIVKIQDFYYKIFHTASDIRYFFPCNFSFFSRL
jgi:hypothetical protein